MHISYEIGSGECLYATLETRPVPGSSTEVAYAWGFAKGKFGLGSDIIVERTVHRQKNIGGKKRGPCGHEVHFDLQRVWGWWFVDACMRLLAHE